MTTYENMYIFGSMKLPQVCGLHYPTKGCVTLVLEDIDFVIYFRIVSLLETLRNSIELCMSKRELCVLLCTTKKCHTMQCLLLYVYYCYLPRPVRATL